MKSSIRVWVILLVLISGFAGKTLFAQEILVVPSQLYLTIPPGFIDVRYLTVSNATQEDVSISCKFDSTWIFMQPRQFSLSPGESRKILMIVFIARDESSQRSGTVFLRKKNEYILSRIQVYVSPPAPPPAPTSNRKTVAAAREAPPQAGSQSNAAWQLASLKQALEVRLSAEVDSQQVEISMADYGLMVRIAGPAIFDMGSEYPRREGLVILKKIGAILKDHLTPDLEILIQGHADDLPIKKTYRYKIPSNWELSSMRAATVARILHQQIGIQGTLIASVGFSYFKPLTKGETLEEKALNRRLEILIKPTEEGAIP